MIGKSVEKTTYNLLKIQEEEGRAGRKDLVNPEQVVLEGNATGKLRRAQGSSLHEGNQFLC